ncbi:MAG: ABC transporter permease subunit [Reichenbachiella sp.]|uniref:ABC transporter permease subunit n=1 Tax=Reichenbachiella sp. TaxID=2184521 RepID=UPI0029666E58|nr:ABC transporter permease subunit [Reichenbachiella sp.]MDW3211347.1 ABC transporter permease subunit [Reichenbachiella sp.]
MIKILKYSFYDLARSRWSYVYFAFYLLLGFVLLFLNSSISKAVITLMNIIVVLSPMIGTIFGIMYHYSAREFTELLLAQPIRRRTIFLGQYLGIATSLSLSLILGLGIPFLIYGVSQSSEFWNFALLIITGTFLTFIFVGLAINIALANENRIKGFSYAILLWLFLAVMYDGIFMILLMVFKDYPLDQFALIASIANPIDLSRILILLKLDIAALLGYTGAIFQKFFGSGLGAVLSFLALFIWTLVPALNLLRLADKKDF